MLTELPKQYLSLSGKTVIEHSIHTLLSHPAISGVMVALQANDPYWPKLSWPGDKPLLTTQGGGERVDSVISGLDALQGKVDDQAWILVHDAARPCLDSEDISRLIETVQNGKACGGLLAMPVRDTMKRGDQQRRIVETVDRDSLWHAQTPQMFRYRPLRETLKDALARGVKVTDECSAFESLGEHPLLVECGAHNLKITHPEDLHMAESYLNWRSRND